jgi:hypothetical protein
MGNGGAGVIKVSPDGHVYVGIGYGVIEKWNSTLSWAMDSTNDPNDPDGQDDYLGGFAISPDGQYLYSNSGNNWGYGMSVSIKKWQTSSLYTGPISRSSAASYYTSDKMFVSPSGQYLYLDNNWQFLKVSTDNIAGGVIEASPWTGTSHTGTYSPDGSSIYSATSEYNPSNGQYTCQIKKISMSSLGNEQIMGRTTFNYCTMGEAANGGYLYVGSFYSGVGLYRFGTSGPWTYNYSPIFSDSSFVPTQKTIQPSFSFSTVTLS